MEEAIPAQRKFAADLLADSSCQTWVAVDADGQQRAFLIFVGPASRHWGQTRLQTPENSVYVQIAYTVPGARGTGVGAALVGYVMAWAQEAGYAYSLADWAKALALPSSGSARAFAPSRTGCGAPWMHDLRGGQPPDKHDRCYGG
jgi:GNAT superfamily N-acetyltransferase